MDVYHPERVYSSIDSMGRYAYGNQPRIAQWNLARLAETLLPLLAEDKDAAVEEAQEAIDAFTTAFETAYAAGLSRKLGLSDRGRTICPWHKTSSSAWLATAPISLCSSAGCATPLPAPTATRMCAACLPIAPSTIGRRRDDAQAGRRPAESRYV